MNILSLNKFDLGGLSFQLCAAINKLTSHYAVSVHTLRVYTKKPVMVMLKTEPTHNGVRLVDADEKRLRRLVKNADLLHFNEYNDLPEIFGIKPGDCREKKIIFHGHGGVFRKFHVRIERSYRERFPQMKVITSTPDLLEGRESEATWFPSIVPIEQWRRQYRKQRNNPPIIYYSPTKEPRRWMWDWETLCKVTTALRAEGFKVEIQRERRITHQQNLALKAKADIYFDELKIGYGINAIEAAAFELCVIHGESGYWKEYMRLNNIQCPFIGVTSHSEEELKIALRRLLVDQKYRETLGRKSYQYVKATHSPQVCVDRYLELIA